MSDEALAVGLVGVGPWARRVHVPNLLATDGVVLAGICTRSEVNARAASEAAGREIPWWDDYERFLAESPCEAVIVATPNWTHEDHALGALAAGKHVLCEKPVSLAADGCDRLAEAVAGTGRVFQVGFELRYADVPVALRRLVAEGTLGTPRMVAIRLRRNWGTRPSGWRADREKSGGLYGELLCHYTDLAAFVLGAQPIRASVAGGYVSNDDLPDFAATILAYPTGAVADVTVSLCTSTVRKEVLVEVIGDRASVEAEILSGRICLLPRTDGAAEDLSPPRPADYRFDGYPGSLESLASFAECIRTGATPAADLPAGRGAVLTALACQQSLDSDQQAVEIIA